MKFHTISQLIIPRSSQTRYIGDIENMKPIETISSKKLKNKSHAASNHDESQGDVE